MFAWDSDCILRQIAPRPLVSIDLVLNIFQSCHVINLKPTFLPFTRCQTLLHIHTLKEMRLFVRCLHLVYFDLRLLEIYIHHKVSPPHLIDSFLLYPAMIWFSRSSKYLWRKITTTVRIFSFAFIITLNY